MQQVAAVISSPSRATAVQGQFEEALQDYSAAIQLNPRHCRAFYNRAFSNDRLRRYDAAVADYTRALEIQPGNATAYHNRASLFERLGRSALPTSCLPPPAVVATLAISHHCSFTHQATRFIKNGLHMRLMANDPYLLGYSCIQVGCATACSSCKG